MLVQGEQHFDFVDQLGEFLVAAEHDVFFLEVGREVDFAEGIHPGSADVVVATAGTGVLTAADGAVGDADHVLDGAQTTPLEPA